MIPSKVVHGVGGRAGKHLHKPLHVYETKNHWYRWQDGWDAVTPPTIRRARFTGAGTRFLTEIAR